MAEPTTTTTTPPAPPTDPANPPAPPAPAPPVDLAAKYASLEAALAEQSATIAKLRDENAQRRIETKEAREQREQAMKAAGDYKGLVKSLEERLAEKDGLVTATEAKLKEIEPLATRQREYEQVAATKIAEAAKGLDPEQKEIFDALPSLAQKKKFLSVIASKQAPATTTTDPPKTPAPPAPPSGVGGPAPGTVVGDLNTMSLDDLKALERQNPGAVAKLGPPAGSQRGANPFGI